MKESTLRALYDATFAGGLNSPEMSRLDVSFDDYFAFLSKLAPAVTRRGAAQSSIRPDFRKLAAEMPPDPPTADPPEVEAAGFERKPSVDLAKVKLDPGVEVLTFDRVKNVRGWNGLERLGKLRTLVVSCCGTDDTQPAKTRIALKHVAVEGSAPECLRTVMASVDAAEVELGSETGPLNLAQLVRGHTRLRSFVATAPLVRGVSSLSGLPVEVLSLSQVALDDEWRSALGSLSSILRRLMVDAGRPFSPEELGDFARMKALRQVQVPCFRELKKQWVDFAVAHPQIGFSFFSPAPPDAKRETFELEEVRRGVDIFRCAKGKKVSFEVAGDLSARRRGFGGSNEDVEDELRAVAKAAKKKVDWRSELDTFVARTPDVETARWLIDRALDGTAGTR